MKSSKLTFIITAVIIVTSPVLGMGNRTKTDTDLPYRWDTTPDRTWAGPEFWANRLQDWQVKDGKLQTRAMPGSRGLQTCHLLTERLAEGNGDFTLQVRCGLTIQGKSVSPSGACGFLIGAAPDVDYRAAALVHCSTGKGGGIYAGINSNAMLFIDDFEDAKPPLVLSGRKLDLPAECLLRLSWKNNVLTIELLDAEGKTVTKADMDSIAPARMAGSIALAAHPGDKPKTEKVTAWFNDFSVTGSKIQSHPDRQCGPVLCTQYTLDNGILNLTAQMMPLGEKDAQTVTLEAKTGRRWKTVATADIIAPGWTAPFRVENWNESKDTPYRVVYQMTDTAGVAQTFHWSGTIRKNPAKKKSIVVAGFTGNHMVRHPGVDRGKYTWDGDWLWFPHNDIVSAVEKHNPDLLFFSGDQVYEGASPTRADKSGGLSTQLDYLYKWYLYCWAYRDLLKDIPCVCIPDDHDVYQGNLWGAGGRKIDRDNKGGYVMSADFVKMVERTQTSHLPEPFDPTPIDRGIGVYYTDLNIGGVSFAVLEDRKFKSGPNGICPKTNSGRADHVIDPNFDITKADVPGAKLLGERQLTFLRNWAADWDDVEMKATLTQTIFAGAATHHGGNLQYLIADYDSNGWPQTGRNNALKEIRKGFGFMIGGDQHLATVIHHGTDAWEDAGWSFCVPSVANFYPRQWAPPTKQYGKVDAPQEFTGRYKDGLGNRLTVWAHTNPRKMGQELAALHDSMPGYGIVKFNKTDRTITMENWPRFADPADRKAEQYTGWPKTIAQTDNYARKAAGYLPTVETNIDDPVVQIIDEKSGEIVYTLRINGRKFEPKVFDKAGTYTVKVGPDSGNMRSVTGLGAKTEPYGLLKMKF